MSSNITEQTVSSVDWHYSVDGNRLGPVPETQVVELIQQDKINKQSLVWNKNMPEWQTILNSKFADLLIDPNEPPPLTGDAVNNTTVWVLAFAPIIGFLMEAFFSGMIGVAQDSLWFVTLALNIALGYADEGKLKKAGHDTSQMGAAWLVPVYLFKRAKILNHNLAYFIVWCVLFVLLLSA